MTGYGDRDWAGCLVRALGRVEDALGELRDELVDLRWRREQEDRENPHRFPGSDPSGYLGSFCEVVCNSGRYDDERYEPLRAALHDAREVLGRHPALAAVMEGDEGWEQFVVRAFDRDYGTSRLAMVAGLLCRAQEAGENGLEIAAGEMQSLLDRCLEEECGSAPDALTIGYHVLLFYGLRLSGEVEIAENLKAVPLEHTEAFLDLEVVRSVAPPSERRKGWEGVSAIVETVTLEAGGVSAGRRRAGGSMRWVRSTSTDATSWRSSRCSRACRWCRWPSFPIARTGRCRFFSAGRALGGNMGVDRRGVGVWRSGDTTGPGWKGV